MILQASHNWCPRTHVHTHHALTSSIFYKLQGRGPKRPALPAKHWWGVFVFVFVARFFFDFLSFGIYFVLLL